MATDSTMTVTDARASLPDLLDRVLAGDEVTITRHGRPVAVVVRPDTLRSRRVGAVATSAARVRESLAAGRASELAESGSLGAARAEELVAAVRADRDRA